MNTLENRIQANQLLIDRKTIERFKAMACKKRNDIKFGKTILNILESNDRLKVLYNDILDLYIRKGAEYGTLLSFSEAVLKNRFKL